MEKKIFFTIFISRLAEKIFKRDTARFASDTRYK